MTDRERFRPTAEGEARLLCLIDGFSRVGQEPRRSLEGRVKLAKLDFLLRYPEYLQRILDTRGAPEAQVEAATIERNPIEQRMVRYRYGPWDPAYYALLGRLVGKGLVEVVPLPGKAGFGYRTTELGQRAAASLLNDESWSEIGRRITLLRRHLDLTGESLKTMVYSQIPEVSSASWNQAL
ncbi:MAG TPA: hypothetical protein VHC43_14140 [Mycobacteriales bacterium]|nr:hypothetical protein [Mycobacteriales bacterium]